MDNADSYAVRFDETSLNRQHRAASIIAPAIRLCTRPLGSIRIHGGENLPRTGPVIVAAYHHSNLDPIILGLSIYAQGRLPRYLAKHTLFRFPLTLGLKPLGQIPVMRGSSAAGDSLRYAREALAAGQTVTIYPEGTHTKDPEQWPGRSKSGTARLALETGAPIVPAAHWGVQHALKGKARLPKLGPSRVMDVSFSEPIMTAGIEASGENVASLTRHVTARIARELARLRGEELPERYRDDLEWRAS